MILIEQLLSCVTMTTRMLREPFTRGGDKNGTDFGVDLR